MRINPNNRGDPPVREVLYGRQALRETLAAGRRAVHALRVADGVRPAGMAAEIVRLARQRGVPITACDKRDLDRLTSSGHHQGMAAETGPYPYVELDGLLREAESAPDPVFLLVLDHVQDPQNAGSLMRTAEAAGVQGVILAIDRAVGVTPAVVRASSGAVEHLRVAAVASLAGALDLLRRKGVWVHGLDATPEAVPYSAARLDGPSALVVGSEGAGLSRSVRAVCDDLIRLPLRGRVESLNAAVAGAIAMYEIVRQRAQKKPDGGS